MTDPSLEVNMPGMPHTSVCINVECDVFMFVNRSDCPQCHEHSMYKVVDMKYYVTRE